MSIASYRRNVERGVAGRYQPICFLAAVEQLSPYSLSPTVYKEYVDFLRWHDSLTKTERKSDQPETEEIFDYIFSKLGGLSCGDVVFKRANTTAGLKRIVNRLLAEEYSVIVDIDYVKCRDESHSVGLVPSGEPDHYYLVSNQVPEKLQGFVTLDDIGKRLAREELPYMERYPFNNANITALPPM